MWAIPIDYTQPTQSTVLTSSNPELARRLRIITEFCEKYESRINEDTRNLFDLVFIQRKNIFLTGVAGTGKSYQLRLLYLCSKELFENRNATVLCSSTGSSALNIGIADATTVHSWSGLMVEDRAQRPIVDGELHWCDDEVKNYVKTPGYRISTTELIFIDEISMIGAFYLKTLDALCKTVKKSNKSMGGIQVVFIGDMLQLPPVKDKHPFLYKVWNHLSVVTYRLTKIYRQESTIWAELLNKIRVANVSKRGDKIFTTIDTGSLRLLQTRSVKSKEEIPLHCLWLYSKRSDANCHNHRCLNELTSHEMYTSTSSDSSYAEVRNKKLLREGAGEEVSEWITLEQKDEHLLSAKEQKMIHKDVGKVLKEVDQEFKFKVGARVMCKKNLHKAGGLVNGARGIITNIRTRETDALFEGECITRTVVDAICVKFSTISEESHDGCTEVDFINKVASFSESPFVENEYFIPISKNEAWFLTYEFKNVEYLSNDLRVIRTRKQFPFMLAFAITVHQSQGLTLDDVVIDLNNCFAPGQAYVAMSRCKSLERMHLLNFKPSYLYSDQVAVRFDTSS